MPTPVSTASPLTNAITEYFGGSGYVKTYTATGTIAAGNLVEFTGNRTVAATGTGGTSVVVAGVALHDAISGQVVSVGIRGTWPMVAQGAITAGARLKSGTVAGAVAVAGATPDARAVIGVAEEAIADTATGRVTLVGLG
jgi:hypothetical protein